MLERKGSCASTDECKTAPLITKAARSIKHRLGKWTCCERHALGGIASGDILSIVSVEKRPVEVFSGGRLLLGARQGLMTVSQYRRKFVAKFGGAACY